MRNTPTRDTPAELALRRRLHASGLRYRVDVAPVAGLRRRADVVFPRQQVAVFVDGCFWHGCRAHKPPPKANKDWWEAKLEGNRRRDADTNARLAAAGWTVIRVWEHDDAEAAAAHVQSVVASLRASPRGHNAD